MMRNLVAAVVTLAPALANAHPGHGQTSPGSWAHYLLEPVHAIPLAIAAWGVALLVVALKRRRIA